jgi:hypothetical protein
LTSFLVFIGISFYASRLNACGPYDPSYHYFNLFVPEWIFSDEYSPTFATNNDNFRNIWSDAGHEDQNLKSWNTFFGGKVNQDALKYVLYGTYHQAYYPKERRAVLNDILFEDANLSDTKIQASKTYLNLALDLEPIANQNPSSWNYKPDAIPETEKDKVIFKLERELDKAKSPFLKERYAFQLLKAYRYTGNRFKAKEVYDQHLKNTPEKSMIHYWAMDHIAGIYLSEGKNGQGYYHFLKVFKNSPNRRYSAYYSFNIGNEKDWEATYSLCKDEEEKALMHFLRGTRQKTLGLQDAKDIFGLLGNHQWLKLLFAREINKLESLNFSYFEEKPIHKLLDHLEQNGSLLENKEQLDYANQLLSFAKTLQVNHRQDGFWTVAKAYLELICGQFNNSGMTMDNAGKLQKPYDKIGRTIELALLILQEDQFSHRQQDFIAQEIVEIFEDSTAYFYTERNNEEFILDLLSYKMEQQDQAVLADMFARTTIYVKKDNPVMEEVEGLLAFVQKPVHTQLEWLALKHFFNIGASWDVFLRDTTAQLKDMEYNLLDVKGVLLMRNPDRLEEALAIFDSIPEKYDFPLEHNPFNMSVKDIIWDNPTQTRSRYTRNSFVKKLIEIKNIAAETNSPTDLYLLGNAYYNMTYFGPAYYMMNYFRSGSSFDGFYDCQPALDFYKKAIKYAPSDEFAARACFMAAKAEQNIYVVKRTAQGAAAGEYWWGKYEVPYPYSAGGVGEYRQYQQTIKAEGYRSYFEMLRKKYKHTQYYQKAIQECKYFEYYTTRL